MSGTARRSSSVVRSGCLAGGASTSAAAAVKPSSAATSASTWGRGLTRSLLLGGPTAPGGLPHAGRGASHFVCPLPVSFPRSTASASLFWSHDPIPPALIARQIGFLSARLWPCRKMATNVSSSGGENGAETPASESTRDSGSPPPVSIPVTSTLASPLDNSPTPISASSSIRKSLSLWPGTYHSPVTQALWEARSSIFERLLDSSNDGLPQSELLTNTPSQSRTSIVYNFSSDYILREQYRDPWNEVRIGKLLEDLDALAGTISVKVGAYWDFLCLCLQYGSEHQIFRTLSCTPRRTKL